jgi:chromate transport protein ChrA
MAALASLGLSGTGDSYALEAAVGAFALALLLSLIPARALVRAYLIGAAGVVAALVLPFAKGEPGLDRVGWAIIAMVGLVGWVLGFIPFAVIRLARRHRPTDDSPG